VKRILNWIRKILFPPPGSSRWQRLLPFFILTITFLALAVSSAYAWDYTNSPEFCGGACHGVHPAEDISYQVSPHAEVKCVECHIGREFVGNQFVRKLGDVRHVLAHISKNYEYPLHVKTLRPAQEVCEQCHNPDKFSDDSQRVFFHYGTDEANTESRTYLLLKTGGGTIREGLGRGIHWHIENKVYFYATDKSEQVIPYVKFTDAEGLTTEYVDITADFDTYSISDDDLIEMDCITCHNRITHSIPQPEEAVDSLIFRQIVSSDIPEIKAQAVTVLRGSYTTTDQAMNAISGLTGYYQENHPDYYDEHSDLIYQAVEALKEVYAQSVFPDQKIDWDTHPDNLGHQDDPGCFRCHDGKHLNASGYAIRLECNLCHAIPVISGPDDLVTHLDINHEPQPDTHHNPNWIALHTIVFDEETGEDTCGGCHDVNNYDLADNSTFCANEACHDSAVDNIDLDIFDDLTVRQKMLAQLPHYPEQFPLVEEWETPSLDTIHREQEGLECEDCHDLIPIIGPPPNEMCIACHGETKQGLFDLTSNLEPNPHDEHEGAGKCSFCHQNFGKPRSPCALCHEDVALEEVNVTE
jgi:hypothetical protein